MLLDLRDFFAIQEREQIPESGAADQELQPCPAAAKHTPPIGWIVNAKFRPSNFTP
jgi:hypothetical protein